MINLLSHEAKAELAAAKRNVILRKYVFTLLSLALLVAASYGVGYLILNQEAINARAEVARYAPQREKYKDVIKQAETYNKNLAIAKAILGNEFIYSDLPITLAKTLPKNVVLNTLSITNETIAKPLELNISAKSYADAVAAKDAFQSSPYFKDTKLRTIERASEQIYAYKTSIITTIDIAGYNAAQKAGKL